PANMWVPLVVLATLSFSFWFQNPISGKSWFKDLVPKPVSAIRAPAATPVHGAAEATAVPVPVAAPGPSHGAQAVPVPDPAGHGATSPPTPGHAAAAQGHGAGAESAHDAHITHVAHRTAMYLSILIAGLGIFFAFGVYMFGWVNPDRVAAALAPVHSFLLNKWYFDELYEATVIGGSKALSRGLAWFDLHVVDGLVNLVAQLGVFLGYLIGKFDNYVVDGAVNGLASATIGSGSILRRVQTGKLYHYVFVLAGGALVIFLIKAF
ncbi:MAG: NADH-quinone oxidoreductase subunit L, partial [bacterium]|nr:NADH-quinone oxidoreductase subunit L [bacterium]